MSIIAIDSVKQAAILQESIEQAVQDRLDSFAKTRGYDGIQSAATYATSANAKFKAEGQCAVDARDATWAKCYEILAAVQAGTRTVTSYADIESDLPALNWPA